MKAKKTLFNIEGSKTEKIVLGGLVLGLMSGVGLAVTGLVLKSTLLLKVAAVTVAAVGLASKRAAKFWKDNEKSAVDSHVDITELIQDIREKDPDFLKSIEDLSLRDMNALIAETNDPAHKKFLARLRNDVDWMGVSNKQSPQNVAP